MLYVGWASTKAVIETTRDISISTIFETKDEEVDLYGDKNMLSVDVDVLREQLSPAVIPPEEEKQKKLDGNRILKKWKF